MLAQLMTLALRFSIVIGGFRPAGSIAGHRKF
jgi:hypothetical protein